MVVWLAAATLGTVAVWWLSSYIESLSELGRTDGRLRLRSIDQELAVDIAGDSVGTRTRPEWGWAGYPIGVWHGFVQSTGLTTGVDVVFGGDLPMASGLSPSPAHQA